MLDFLTLLRENPYPGRGILVSRDLVYYFIMGRSCLLYTSDAADE